MQRLLKLIYPAQCISCNALVEQEYSLCGDCWKGTPFIGGLVCDACGTPLPGQSSDKPEYCDDCLTIGRPWQRGRASLLYRGNAKRLILSLKHGDRLDLVKPAAGWMATAAQPLITPDLLIIPIPAHWTRLFRRRYNQAALLAHELARLTGLDDIPDALVRSRRTAVHDGMGRDARFVNMAGAIAPHPHHGLHLQGRNVLLIDDVMTSGATFAAATDACHAVGAEQVFVLALARVAKAS